MLGASQGDLPCFSNGGVAEAVRTLEERLLLNHTKNGKKLSKNECISYAEGLIKESYDHWKTHVYDKYQFCSQGIF